MTGTVSSVKSRYEPLPNPPPAGSIWERIERARQNLGWSARKLSTEAGFKSPSQLTVISTRNTWKVEMDTVRKFIVALTRAGIPENDLLDPGSMIKEPEPPSVEESVEHLVRKGYRLKAAQEAVDGIKIYWVARRDYSRGSRFLSTAELAGMAEAVLKSAMSSGVLSEAEVLAEKRKRA